MIKKQALLSLLVLTLRMEAGVYILADLPQGVAEIAQNAQDALVQDIVKLNAQNETAYLFQSAQFSPHLSLAFVSQEELSAQEAQKKFSGITQALQDIASKHAQINISNNFKDAAIDYWPGKFEVACGGSQKKNYVNVVLKASNNPELAKLVQNITTVLKEKYNIEQRFPFSTHVTIGRICDRHDKPIDATLKQKLEKISAGHVEKQSSKHKKNLIQLDEFKLKGHDGSEEKFVLSNFLLSASKAAAEHKE